MAKYSNFVSWMFVSFCTPPTPYCIVQLICGHVTYRLHTIHLEEIEKNSLHKNVIWKVISIGDDHQQADQHIKHPVKMH